MEGTVQTGCGRAWKLRLKKGLPVLYFLFVFFLYFSLMSEPYFTDEQDVIFGGYNIAKGRDLYRFYLSQHMPFSYYFASLSAICGARTVFQFRLGAYLMLSMVWETVFLRHRRFFPAVSLFAMPLLYLSVLKTITFGTAMISDHWQGIGQAMILLELIRYAREKRITAACAGMVSLGIMLSLGTVFVAAYSVFCFFLGMVALQIGFIFREPKPTRAGLRRQILREDLRLAALCLAPFLALLGWYLISGNVSNAFEGAYDVNVKYYSQYTGGFGSDPVGIVWETVASYGRFVWGEAAHPGGYSLLNLGLALGSLACCVWLGRKNPTVGVTAFLATMFCGIRSYDDFHGMAYFAQTTCLLSLGWGALLEKRWRRKAVRWGTRIVSGGAAGFLLASFVIWAGYNLIYPQILLDRTARAETQIMDLLTEPGEEIHSCETPYFCQDVMDLELLPQEACDAVSIPWYYEMWKDRQMASILQRPRVVLYDREEQTWGHVFREYAPEFDAFIQENYLQLEQAEDIWVLKSWYPEAEERLRKAGYGRRSSPRKEKLWTLVPVKYFAGEQVSAFFTAEEEKICAIRFCAACFHRRSDPRLTVQVLDPQTGEILGEAKIQGEKIADNFSSRCPLRASLTPGREYEVVFRVEEIRGKGDMEFYFRPDGMPAMSVEYE